MTNSNLESFFNSHKIVDIISDYEGEQIKLNQYSSSRGLIICGDILDSTAGGGSTIEKSTGIINNIKKTFNIRNIISIINNKNIHLIFGNRDVNKFKCKYLTKMKKNQKGDIYDNFNKGNINLSEGVYTDLKKSKIDWVVDTKHWYPFWNPKLKDHLGYWQQEEKDITASNDKVEYGGNIFLKRFYRIFGVDGPQGSLSANNLLYTIPLELGIKLEETRLDKLEYLDYLAFIVLAVFRVMTTFNKSPPSSDITSIGTKQNLNKTNLLSLLNRFYSGLPNTSFVSYFNDDANKRLYIFSHGGVTSTLINNFDINIKELREILETNEKSLTLTGGTPEIETGGTSEIELDKKSIMTNLDAINKEYLEIMKKTLNKIAGYIPNIDMLLALSTSANYKPPGGSEIFILNSPISPGIDILEKNIFFCTDSEIVQIFGHVPKGFATTINKFKSKGTNTNYTYLINLDYSQSFKYSNLGGKTNSFIIFEKNKTDGPILRSKIDISKISLADNENFANNKYYTDIPLDSKSTTIETVSNQHILESRFKDYENYKPKDTSRTSRYHGLYKDQKSKSEYYVFTILDGPFGKELYLKKTGVPEPQAKKSSEGSTGYLDVAPNPTGDSNSDAKLKYYKYKRKYLELKNYILMNSKIN